MAGMLRNDDHQESRLWKAYDEDKKPCK